MYTTKVAKITFHLLQKHKIKTRKTLALSSQSLAAKLKFNKRLTHLMKKKMMTTLVEIAFKLKMFTCQQSKFKTY